MNQSIHCNLVDSDKLLQVSDINSVREDVMGENTFLAKGVLIFVTSDRCSSLGLCSRD